MIPAANWLDFQNPETGSHRLQDLNEAVGIIRTLQCQVPPDALKMLLQLVTITGAAFGGGTVFGRFWYAREVKERLSQIETRDGKIDFLEMQIKSSTSIEELRNKTSLEEHGVQMFHPEEVKRHIQNLERLQTGIQRTKDLRKNAIDKEDIAAFEKQLQKLEEELNETKMYSQFHDDQV